MAFKLYFIVISLAALQIGWMCSSTCNVPKNISPVNLQQLKGIWRVQALTYGQSPYDCITQEFFPSNNEQQGILNHTLFIRNGSSQSYLYFVYYVRPGFVIYEPLQNSSFTSWNFIKQVDDESLFTTWCFLQDNAILYQESSFISRKRNVPQQTINNAFIANNVSLDKVHYFNEVQCNN